MRELIKEKYIKTYNENPTKFISVGGRFELIGNHTDHNHGLCISGGCSLCIYSGSSKRNDNVINLFSEGYGQISVNLNNLSINEDEKGTSKALIRGVAQFLVDNNFKVGGLNIYILSKIPNGAGVSSSAAFESLIGQLFNLHFNDGQIPKLLLCKAGQYAEQYYYGKMCGLLDQIGVTYGGFTFIDFNKNPIHIESLKLKISDYSFVIVNTGGSHANLSDLYVQIPTDMYEVAKFFGKKYLIEVSKEDVIANKDKFNIRQFNRAIHFFNENSRVEETVNALKNNNIQRVIELMNLTRESCIKLLKNMCINDEIKGSPIEACELIDKASDFKAGVKINGGGFAGSVISLVPNEVLKNVYKECALKYGKNNVFKLSIPKEGIKEFK